MKTRLLRALCCGLLLLSSLSLAQADAYRVVFDVSSLFANPGNAPFSLNFQLVDGDGVANNTINITNILFGGGGSATDNPSPLGGASGSLMTGVTLTDTAFLNDFLEDFTPGNGLLEFDLHFTSNYAGSPAPDRFTIGIYDGVGGITTTGPGDALLGIDLTGPNPTVEVYSLTGDYSGTPTITAIPEIPGLALPAFLLLFGGVQWRRRAHSRDR